MRIEFVGDVVTQPFSVLSKRFPDRQLEIYHHDIDQHFQVLMGGVTADVLICHTMASFFLNGSSGMDARARMQAYCDAIQKVAATGKCFVVVNTLSVPRDRIVGTQHLQRLRLVADLNAMLFDLADHSPFVSIADIAGIVSEIGQSQSISIQNDLVMRMPYTRHILPAITGEYARAVTERIAPRKKVVLLDADNTLWAGIVGEDGIDALQVDHQFPGIVHRKFQQQLLELRSSGLLLALVSKNNEPDVREAFDSLDMPLKWDSFSAVRANWNPKSENIALIASELNVGLDSMIFIDDNVFEIEQVRAAHPMVECFRFDGRNAKEALSLLYGIAGLGAWAVTDEDAAKSEQYAQEAQRKQIESTATSVEEYIASLGIQIEAGVNRTAQVKRISQLTNKTNQFNLTTRRYSEADILVAMQEGKVFDFRVTDKFGDMGIVGVAIIRHGAIEAFLMSCRALGRHVEQTMLAYCCAVAGEPALTAHFIPTAKNGMAADFYEQSGLFKRSEDREGEKIYALLSGACIAPPDGVREVH
jgi:FkbH-like protein